MTVKELVTILGQLPDDMDEATIYLGGETPAHVARCVVVVPDNDEDPNAPRVVLQTGLVRYPPGSSRPMDDD